MKNIQKINENIFRFTLPYKDIYTTMYIVKTENGVLIFDAASFDTDTEEYIMPAIKEAGIKPDEIKFVFISHNHADHSGGLAEFMKRVTDSTIVSRSDELISGFSRYSSLKPEDGQILLDCLKVVTIPGHTLDSSAILDTRTDTLISGDSLQLYGIMGSGLWASNIRFPEEHINAVDKLRKMNINRILTAHDYVPYGYDYDKSLIPKALDACIEPFEKIKSMIAENPDADDKKIAELYNSPDIPTLGAHVVSAVRKLFFH